MNDNLLELAKEYIELDKKRKNHEDDLDAIKARMEQISPVLDDYMTANDLTFKIGKATVYKQDQIWPKKKEGVSKHDLYEVIRKSDWKWLVKDNINGHQLAAQVRECIAENGELPEEIAEVLDASPTTKIKVCHS